MKWFYKKNCYEKDVENNSTEEFKYTKLIFIKKFKVYAYLYFLSSLIENRTS